MWLENIQFTYHFAFFLIFVWIGFFVFFLKKRKKGIVLISFSELEKVYKNSNIFYPLYFFLLFLILFLYVLLLANPQEVQSSQVVKKNGIDISIVFDVSLSMEAQDLKPSRIEAAKKVLTQFFEGITSDRVSLVLFAWKPFASTPLTFDMGFLKNYVQKITTSIVDQTNDSLNGTAIWDAIVLWESQLEDGKNQNREKIMILITDGEANKGLDPLIALKLLKDKKIRTYTIGIGWLEKTNVIIKDNLWFEHLMDVGGVDEATLKKIADETGAQYYRATSGWVFEDIFSKIQKLEKKEVSVDQKMTTKARYDELISIILACMGVVFGISIFKNMRT